MIFNNRVIMTDTVISSSKADGKQLAILATDAKAGKKAYAKLNKEIHACDKVADQVWYEKGMRILKMRESGLYKWGQDKSQLVFDEKGKIIEWTFERWLETEHQITDRRGQQLMRGVTFIRKLSAPEANENAKIVRLEKPVLPSNEWQIRPLLTDLQHDGERIHVWAEVANSGEKKITAELVQREVDKFKASGLVVEDVEIKLPDVVIPNNVHVGKNSGDNEWYTPALHIELARTVMGGIDCDPATSEIANRTVKAETIFTAENDGRAQTWRGRVWMNPPYANPLMSDFAEAVSAKFESGEIEQACILVNNATETKWFQRMLEAASAVCFPKSRIKFLDPEGNPSGAPLQGQAIVYMGESIEAFKDAFKTEGAVLTHV